MEVHTKESNKVIKEMIKQKKELKKLEEKYLELCYKIYLENLDIKKLGIEYYTQTDKINKLKQENERIKNEKEFLKIENSRNKKNEEEKKGILELKERIIIPNNYDTRKAIKEIRR